MVIFMVKTKKIRNEPSEYYKKLEGMNINEILDEENKISTESHESSHKLGVIKNYKKYSCPKCGTWMEPTENEYNHKKFMYSTYGGDSRASKKSEGLYQCPKCKFVIFLD